MPGFEEMRVVLKQSAEDKIKSDAEEKELIRNISHDLKTPLTAIKGYVEACVTELPTRLKSRLSISRLLLTRLMIWTS